MADEDQEAIAEEEGGEEESSGGRKKLILFIVLPLLIIVGGVAGAYFAGLLDPVIAMVTGAPPEGEEGEPAEARPVVFFDLPEIVVNLNTGGRKTMFLKVKLSLEIAKAEDVAKVEAVVPRVVNDFQVYLRELRIEDLKGSAGSYRVREELLTRVNAAVAPAKVDRVLINEMLIS